MPEISHDTIWVIDDSIINQKILKRILEPYYPVKCESDARVAIERMHAEMQQLGGIIVDLHMPGFSGLDFLEHCHQDRIFTDIPILVATSEEQYRVEKKCLEMGAWDFLSSPFEPTVVRHRVDNAMHRSLLRHNDYDQLTGLYTRERFNQEVRQILDLKLDQQYLIMMVDIDNFKGYNTFYGIEEGNRLLRYLGKELGDLMLNVPQGIFARYSADTFLVFGPYVEGVVERFVSQMTTRLSSFNSSYRLKPSIGVYIIEDESLPIDMMEDRVRLAARQCKGKYREYVGYYDSSMGDSIVREQFLVNSMEKALKNKEFKVYYQPKYSLTTGKPHGAEALVRWQMEDGTMVMPGEFIPIFEKNVSINTLDDYVLEQVCIHQKQILDKGYQAIPISVNVSLLNLYNPNFARKTIDLIRSYGLTSKHIELEFTESAFLENRDMILDVMHELHEAGFVIYMDDFGKGSASLGMLRDLPVDYLKIDMSLLPKNPARERGGKILTSIIRMAEQLKLAVVMEGVENEDQVRFLQDVNCDYVQGFFFAKPMPETEYDAIVEAGYPPVTLPIESSYVTSLTGIWSSENALQRFFDHVESPMLVVMNTPSGYEVVRTNHAYQEQFGDGVPDENGKCKLNWDVSADDQAMMDIEFTKAWQTGKDVTFSLRLQPGEDLEKETFWAEVKVSPITRVAQRVYFLVKVENFVHMNKEDVTFDEECHTEGPGLIALKMAGVLSWIYHPKTHEIHQFKELRMLYNFGERISNVPQSLIDLKVVHPDDVEEFLDVFTRLDRGEPYVEASLRMKRAVTSPQYYYVHFCYSTQYDANGEPERCVGVLLETKNGPKVAKDDMVTIRQMRSMTPDTYFLCVLNLNREIMESVQTSVPEMDRQLENITSENVFEQIAELFCTDPSKKKQMSTITTEMLLRYYYKHPKENYELSFRKIWGATGRIQYLALEVYFMKNKRGEIYAFCYIRDVDRRFKEKKMLENRASQDGMTGLLNHAATVEQIEDYLRGDGKDGSHALYMIDVNHFKKINDTYGHLAGDKVIKEIAHKLESQFRRSDVVGRFGGDEFVVFMKDIRNDDRAAEKEKELAEFLSFKNWEDGKGFVCSCSIGTSVCHQGDKDFTTMLKEADERMYKAKKKHKSLAGLE